MRGHNFHVRNATIWLLVALIHALLLWWLAIGRSTEVPEASLPPIDVWLTVSGGGGAPARGSGETGLVPPAPSSLHRLEDPRPFIDTAPVAPQTPAPEPVLVIGTSTNLADKGSQAAETPDAPGAAISAAVGLLAGAGSIGTSVDARGQGAGEQGNGQGGSGTGNGPGHGGASWVRELSATEKRSLYPRDGLRRRIDGVAVLSCVMRQNDRVSNCRILSETPRGLGFGRAAIEVGRMRGVRAPRLNGQPLLNERIRLEVRFDYASTTSLVE